MSSIPSETNLYEWLGISEHASQDEIHRAYRKAARRLHPDVNIEAGATEHFLNIKEAYEVLSDPDRRAAYDQKIPRSHEPTQPVRIDIRYSREAIQHSTEQQLIYAHIELQILPDPDHIAEPPPPLNVALVLDTSTSMKGARLEIVKATAIELIRQLRPQDTVSIVAFDDKAEISLLAGSHINIRKAEARIHGLHASGGTEIYKGLEAGFNEVLRNYRPSHTNHIILITDGHTYGDETACQRLANEAAQKDIGLSSLGIGGKWNDTLLDDLATRTGGDCLYVREPKDIRDLLTKKMTRLQEAYAERMSLDFQCGSGISLNYAFRLSPEIGALPIESPIKLGSLSMGSSQRILLELIVDPIPPEVEKALLFDGAFRFEIPSKSASYQIPITLFRPVDTDPQPETPSHHISKALSRLTLYRMQEKANEEISNGKFVEASIRLKNVATHLLAQGEPELAQTVLAEAEKIKLGQNLSEEGKKRIKYGTRALLLPAGNNQDHEL
ncbi:MAG: DnaJ domain-containing protein [Chloroflexota bacterium]